VARSALLFGHVVVRADEPEGLPAGGLEIEVRVVDLDHLHAEVDDLLLHLLDIVGAQFQEDYLKALSLIAALASHAIVINRLSSLRRACRGNGFSIR